VFTSHYVLITALVVFSAVACSRQQKPVLYPNETLRLYGQSAADRAIEECMQKAAAYLDSTQHSTALGSAATGAVVGAAGGGAAGAAWGNRGGRGAAAGAAGAAAAGLTRGVIRDLEKAGKAPPVYKNFVDHCLREKGYAPIGWQ
jgi:outer membrane lipoprotein SlyB